MVPPLSAMLDHRTGLGGSSSSDCDGVASGQGGGEEGVLQPAVKRRRRTYELGTAAYFDSPTFSDCRVLLTDGTSLHGHRRVSKGVHQIKG